VAKYKKQPIQFHWSQGGDQLQLEEAVDVGGSGYPSVVAISGAKKVYAIMRSAMTK